MGELQGETVVICIAFSPDGEMLAWGSLDGTVRLWQTKTSFQSKVLGKHDLDVEDIAFSYDSKTLVSGSLDKSIRLWELPNGKCIRILKGHENRIKSVSFSLDAKILASGSEDGTARIGEVANGKLQLTLPHPGGVLTVAWSPNCFNFVSGDHLGTVRLWKVTCEENNSFKVHLLWQKGINVFCCSNGLSLNQATGLSLAHHRLFVQRSQMREAKPTLQGEPSKRETIKVLAERNSQVLVPGGIIKDLPFGKELEIKAITPDQWLVSMVRKKVVLEEKEKASRAADGTRHVFLLIQGVQRSTDGQYYSFIKAAHFFLDQDRPHSSFSGRALVQVRDQSPRDLRQMATEMVAVTYQISKTKAEELLANIEKDRSKNLPYHLFGSYSLFSGKSDSCLTWCEKQLKEVGIPVKDYTWRDLFCAYPEKHLPQVQAQETDDRRTRCSVM